MCAKFCLSKIIAKSQIASCPLVLCTEPFYPGAFRAGCVRVCLRWLRDFALARAPYRRARARAVKSARVNLGICSVSISRITYLLQRRAARRLYNSPGLKL